MTKSVELVFHNIRPLSKQNSRDRKTGGRTLKASYKTIRELIQWEAKRQLLAVGWHTVKDESITIEYWIVWPFPPADFENMTTWFTDALQGVAYIDDALIDDCAGIHPVIGKEKLVQIRLTRKPLSEFSRLNFQRQKNKHFA